MQLAIRKLRDLEVPFLALCMVLPGFMYVLYYYVLDRSTVSQLHYGVSKFLIFLMPFVYVVFVKKQRVKIFTFSRREIAFGLLSGVAVAVIIFALYSLYADNLAFLLAGTDKIRGVLASFGVQSPATYFVMGAFIALGNSLLEEYYWRWFAFRELAEIYSVRAAGLVSSAGFVVHHVIFLMNNLPEGSGGELLAFSGMVFLGGLFWCYLYYKFKSITAPFICHIIADMALIWLGYVLLFKSTIV